MFRLDAPPKAARPAPTLSPFVPAPAEVSRPRDPSPPVAEVDAGNGEGAAADAPGPPSFPEPSPEADLLVLAQTSPVDALKAAGFTFDEGVPRLPVALPSREDVQAWIGLSDLADVYDRRQAPGVPKLGDDVVRAWAVLWGCRLVEGLIEAPPLVLDDPAWREFWSEVVCIHELDVDRALATYRQREHG
jgi:hypothetical protein